MVGKVKVFFGEVVTELKKVTWTTRRELMDSTIVVVVSLFILSAVIGLYDYFVGMLLQKLIR